MVDILRLEKDGVTYAKGFINQEGLTIYVLPGYREILEKALGRAIHTATRMLTTIEETREFPGEEK